MESASSPTFAEAHAERFSFHLSTKLRMWWGTVLEKIHAPAKIREFEYIDPVTNQTVYLATGARYSVLHVGGKQLFFSRTTGKFDGTGSLLEERIADGLELLD